MGMKVFFEANPEEARIAEALTKDSKLMRQTAMTEILQEYYASMVGMGDDAFQAKLTAVEKSPECAPIIDAIKKGEPIQQYYTNEATMLKMNRAVGGIPED